jgi:hypothetical protein
MSRQRRFDAGNHPTPPEPGESGLSRRSFLVTGTAAAAAAALSRAALAAPSPARFRRVPTQFIAALSPPDAKSGDNAQAWGLWPQDPGPRGVPLDDYERLQAAGGVAPARWQFDNQAWWLEEHGLIMEKPNFPLAPGQYLVTGDREVTTVLTVHPKDEHGAQRWELGDNAKLYDVTHLRCRSALYTPAKSGESCSPAKAQRDAFPVRPGAAMPPIEGCHKQDYAVLIVIAVGVEDA